LAEIRTQRIKAAFVSNGGGEETDFALLRLDEAVEAAWAHKKMGALASAWFLTNAKNL
jgi:hypothetical protein